MSTLNQIGILFWTNLFRLLFWCTVAVSMFLWRHVITEIMQEFLWIFPRSSKYLSFLSAVHRDSAAARIQSPTARMYLSGDTVRLYIVMKCFAVWLLWGFGNKIKQGKASGNLSVSRLDHIFVQPSAKSRIPQLLSPEEIVSQSNFRDRFVWELSHRSPAPH